MVPTKDRNHSAIFLKYHGEGLLFDCGEGTQRQIKLAKQRLTDVTKVFISHWHGDHVLGIPGLIQSLGASEYSGKLRIYGPKGTEEHMRNMFKAFVFDNKVDLEVIEIDEGVFLETKHFQIEAYRLEHGIRTLGFRFVEKDRRRINLPYVRKMGIPDGPLLGKLQQGKDVEFKGQKVKVEDATKIVKGKVIGIVSDTLLCKGANMIAKDADILISEAAYASDLLDKAHEYKHMTGQQAAQLASQNNVKRLVLTHFSARYKSADEILKDATDVFKETVCAYDLMKVKI